jgi:hypoxanthine phosphoribosyltransferase
VKVLFSESEIQAGVARLAQRIADEYRGRPLTVLGVLNGSIMLLADLIRRLDFPLQVGLIQASSYRGRSTTPGELTINADFLPNVADRDVLLLDDIFDTGRTLSRMLPTITRLEPRSLRVAVLLWKEGRQQVSLVPDDYCFRIPDQFVVGYGLDYNDEYRNLPYVAVLDDEDL